MFTTIKKVLVLSSLFALSCASVKTELGHLDIAGYYSFDDEIESVKLVLNSDLRGYYWRASPGGVQESTGRWNVFEEREVRFICDELAKDSIEQITVGYIGGDTLLFTLDGKYLIYKQKGQRLHKSSK